MESNKLINFLIYWIVTSVVLLFASSVFVNNIVLGNDKIPGSVAAVVSGLILTGVYYLVPTVVKRSGYKIKDENQWVIIYLVANTLLIWIIKRLAELSGLGISSILFVLILAIFVTFIHWLVTKIDKAFKVW